MRSIKKIIPSQKVNMGGIVLDQPLPFRGQEQIDPFLLVHHWENKHEGGEKQLQVGVGPHPHRGFSPVTFIFKGGIYHQDSAGHQKLVEAGGTQWMNSGKGVIHSERPSKKLAEEGGEFEIIQFWINTPASHKMDEYSYQPLSKADTPTIKSKDKLITTSVVAGTLEGHKGKIKTFTDVLILRFEIKAGGKTSFDVPKEYNAFFYQLNGKMKVNGESTKKKDLIWFNNDHTKIEIEGVEDTTMILLSGKPLNESLATYGPFVMNTEAEIRQAIFDYQNGAMGTLHEIEES